MALTIDFVARPPVTGLLHAVSGTHGRRSDHLLTTATVRDGDGTDVAVASGWFALRGARPAGPHPSVPPGDMPRRQGVAALDEPAAATAPTDPCTTPLGRTLGLTGFTRTPDGDVTLELAEVGPLRNSGGTLHGGVAALISSLAALATRDESAARAVVLSMNCHYLRPAGSGGGPVRVTGRQIRRGRTSAVVRGDVHASDGRLAMYTVLTTALEP